MTDNQFAGLDHDGATYDRSRDQVRLNGQQQRVFDAMQGGNWLTLHDIQNRIWTRCRQNEPQQSISARMRDLRKPRFGGHTVERRHLGNGLWAYRLILNQEDNAQ